MTAIYLNQTNVATPAQAVKPSPAKRLYDKVDQVWSYLGKTTLLTRQVLNATLRTCYLVSLCCRTKEQIQRVIARLKLFSIVGVPFTVSSIQATAEKVFKGYHNRDREGVLLGSLSLVIMSTDFVDSLATFTNAVLALFEKPPVKLLSDLGMPIAFGLTTLGGFSRTMQLLNTHRLYRELHGIQGGRNGLTENLKSYLNEKLGVTELESKTEVQKLLARKRASLLRQAPASAVKELDMLAAKLSDPQSKLTQEEIKDSLNKVASSLKKKMIVDAGNLFASMLTFVALCLFFTAAPAVMPFLLLATSYSLRLGFLAYQDFA